MHTTYGKASAPEYQGKLGSLSVNASYEEVLAKALRQRQKALMAGSVRDFSQAALAVAEAYRRLGRHQEAEAAWKESYWAARRVDDEGCMAWALWSGGTLARQRGALSLARRLLALAARLAEQGGDIVARGYSLAGLAETGRIQGDYAAVTTLHEQLLAEARKRGEARHIVWALEGVAQIHRNTGAYDTALEMFEEAARIARDADDFRGHAWALRGIADVLSVQGDTDRALTLLGEAEAVCRRMNLASALAYNHKMRGNVLHRAARYDEAARVYQGALEEFRAMGEQRGSALARLGLVKSLARLGRDREATAADLDELRETLGRLGLHHARDMVERSREELGLVPAEAGAA